MAVFIAASDDGVAVGTTVAGSVGTSVGFKVDVSVGVMGVGAWVSVSTTVGEGVAVGVGTVEEVTGVLFMTATMIATIPVIKTGISTKIIFSRNELSFPPAATLSPQGIFACDNAIMAGSVRVRKLFTDLRRRGCIISTSRERGTV